MAAEYIGRTADTFSRNPRAAVMQKYEAANFTLYI